MGPIGSRENSWDHIVAPLDPGGPMGPQGPKTLIFVNFPNGCSLYPFAFFGGVVVVWHCTAIAAQLAICMSAWCHLHAVAPVAVELVSHGCTHNLRFGDMAAPVNMIRAAIFAQAERPLLLDRGCDDGAQ